MKISHNNIVKKKISKDITQPRHITDVYTWNLVPVRDDAPQVWAQELRDWVKDNPQARTIRQFLDSKQLYKDAYYKMLHRFPVLKEANEYAKQIMGERLWESAVDKKTDWKASHHRLYRYGKEFEEDDAYHAKLSREKNDATVAALISGISHSNKDNIHDSNK